MSTEFKILNEETFSYKRNNKLFLMLLRDGDTYGVEIVSAHDSYGRKFCKDRAQAEKVFDFLTKKLFAMTDYDSTITLLEMCRKLGLGEMKFIFMVHNKKFDQVGIGKLITEFNLKIKSRVRHKVMVIRLFKSKSGACFGEFTGTFLKKDFIFKKT